MQFVVSIFSVKSRNIRSCVRTAGESTKSSSKVWKRGTSREAATQKQDGYEEELRELSATPNLQDSRAPTPHRTHRKVARAAKESVRRGAAAQISNYSSSPEVVAFVAAAVVGRINIPAMGPLKPLPLTANIMKRYGSREGERNEKDKKRTVK